MMAARAAGVAVRWATRERAMDLTGIPESTLLRLVNDGLVGCRKSGTDKRARTVFCVPDIEDWWDTGAEVVREFRV
jgi:hypothetical protein